MGWSTYDDWKLDSPPEYKPKQGDPSCDECGEQFPEENQEDYLKNGLCEECGVHECEMCGERLLEDEAIPFNDGTTDGKPYFCEECAKEEGYEPI